MDSVDTNSAVAGKVALENYVSLFLQLVDLVIIVAQSPILAASSNVHDIANRDIGRTNAER